MSRVKNTQHITKKIGIVPDYAITEIYNKMWDLCEEDGEKKDSRVQKIKYIKSNLELIPDIELPKIIIILNNTKKYEIKYKALLDLLNKLLEHNGLEPIVNITDFRDIPRSNLANEECNQIVLNSLDDLISIGFEKNTNGFHSYKKLKNPILNIIKGLCIQINHDFVSVKISKMVNLNRTFITYYSVIIKT